MTAGVISSAVGTPERQRAPVVWNQLASPQAFEPYAAVTMTARPHDCSGIGSQWSPERITGVRSRAGYSNRLHWRRAL